MFLLCAYQPGLFKTVVPVKGHTRRANGGKIVAVRPYTTRKTQQDEQTKNLFARPPAAEMSGTEALDRSAIAAVAHRFDLTETEVENLLTTPPEELARRDEIATVPNNQAASPQDFEKFPLGAASMDAFGAGYENRYVNFLREFDPSTLGLTEDEAEGRRHETFPVYQKWAKEKIEPPYISVVETDRGRPVSVNRRRVLAARDAGNPIKGWWGPYNPETGNPLKFKDVVNAYCQRAKILSLHLRGIITGFQIRNDLPIDGAHGGFATPPTAMGPPLGKAVILLFKAEQFGLFDAVVPVKGHVTATGTVVAPYRAKRKKRPEAPPSDDLFATKPEPKPPEPKTPEPEPETEVSLETHFPVAAPEGDYGSLYKDGIVVKGNRLEVGDWLTINGFFEPEILFGTYNRREGGYLFSKIAKAAVLRALRAGYKTPADLLKVAVRRGQAFADRLVPRWTYSANDALGEDSNRLKEAMRSLLNAMKAHARQEIGAPALELFSKTLQVENTQQSLTDRQEWNVRSNLYNFAQLFGVKIALDKVVYQSTQSGRSGYTADRKRKGTITIVGRASDYTLFHECGHALEQAHPEIRAMATAFLYDRAGTDREIYSLSEVKGHTYRENEMAYLGRYRDPYIGKIYKDGSTECISMATEEFRDPQLMAVAFAKDPDQFYLALAAAEIGVAASKKKKAFIARQPGTAHA